MQTLKSIDIVSAGMIVGGVAAVFGIIEGLFTGLLVGLFGGIVGVLLVLIGGIILGGIIGFIAGFVLGIIIALIYNFAAGRVGGFKFDFAGTNPTILKGIDIVAYIKVAAIEGAIIGGIEGLIFGAALGYLGSLIGGGLEVSQEIRAGLGIGAVLIGIIFGAIAGAIGQAIIGAIFSFVYNILAGWLGGAGFFFSKGMSSLMKIDFASTIKIALIFDLIFAVLYGGLFLPFTLLSTLSHGGTSGAAGLLALGPLLIALVIFVFVAIFTIIEIFVFNFVAGKMGGLKLTFA